MADGSAKVCYRSGKTILPMDKYVTYQKMNFLPAHFTCAATGVKLTLKTVTSFKDPETGKVEIYQKGKEPTTAPTPTKDANDLRVAAVPDSNFHTTDRMLNIAGKQAVRGATGEDIKPNYGGDAVAITTQTNAPDSNMRTNDRKFNIAGKGDTRDSKDQSSTSQYGIGAVNVDTVMNVEKKPTSVNNVNRTELRHNGVDVYRNE